MNRVEHSVDDDEESAGAGAFGIGEILATVQRYLWLILALGALTAAAVATFSLTLPNRYEAVATVQVDPRAKRITNIEGVLSDLKTDNPTMESEVEIIRSRSITLRVIESLKLREHPEFTGQIFNLHRLMVASGLRQQPLQRANRPPDADATAAGPVHPRRSFPTDPGTEAGAIEPERDAVSSAFDSRLKISRIRNSLLMEIRYVTADPVLSARIANAIASTYIRSQIEAKIQATESASELLEDKLTGLREKVAEAERRIEQFKVEYKMFDTDGRPVDATQLQREMELITAARNRTAEARTRYDQARRMMLQGESQDTVSEVMQSITIRTLRDELSKVARRQAELASKYGPRHPEMEKVQAELAKAQSELASEVGKIIRSLKTELEVATEREQQQAQRLEAIKEQISATKDKQWLLRQLERDAAANKTLYENILNRSKQTEETAGLQTADARVVTEANVPLTPAGPRRMLMTLAGAAAGLGIGLGLAFLIEFSSGGLSRPEDVVRRLHTAHLASLPWLRRDADGVASSLHALRAMITVPDGPIADAIRTIRHEIDNRRRDSRSRIVLVTSSKAREGKTFVAANLALHYAMTGQRALLIDADFRQRELSQTLGLTGAPGLIDVLAGTIPAHAAVFKDTNSGLHVMAAAHVGGMGNTAPEALAGNRLLPVLRHLQNHYDIIVLDSAPLLPIVDTRLIADAADHIALVATWRETPVALLRRAIKCLGANESKLSGIVINRMNPKVHAEAIGFYPARAPQSNVHVLRRHAA